MKTMRSILSVASMLVIATTIGEANAQTTGSDPTHFGIKVRGGGRYDNVRKCVASPTGTKGGIAADLSVFAEVPMGNGTLLHFDLPVMRPILFAAAFHMLQFEPTVSLKFTEQLGGRVRWVAGPALGVSLHYGPDYNSEASGAGRTASFFAMGPTFGAYAGLNVKRPGEAFDFQFGFSPYVTPLFGINDPTHHRGVVIGGLIDAAFICNKKK